MSTPLEEAETPNSEYGTVLGAGKLHSNRRAAAARV